MKILVIDVGGTHVKALISGMQEPFKIPSGRSMSAEQMVHAVRAAISGMDYDVVSIGFPGPVRDGRPFAEPVNLGTGWVSYDFERGFGRPVRMINDAALQALGSYQGGRMLFLGLGTGLGSALIVHGAVAPLELAHLPYKKGRSFEDYVGARGLERRGKKRWRRAVLDVSERLRAAMQAEDMVLGGGNAKLLKELPQGARLGRNALAFVGGFRLWSAPETWLPARNVQAHELRGKLREPRERAQNSSGGPRVQN